MNKLSVLAISVSTLFSQVSSAQSEDTAPPNIIWIIGEDMGPDLGFWGTDVHTPNIDQLAAEGMRFTHVFGTASVCMPNRTAMITGVTQTTLGAVTMRPPKRFMRSLPGDVVPLPVLLRKLGYSTGNVGRKTFGCNGKDDWNFKYDGKGWDKSKLADLVSNQPFYAQFNFPMAHRPFRQDNKRPIDPATVELPPYYPDHPVTRQSWSDYLESIQHLDRDVGNVLSWLQREGLADNTIVFFLSDHGEAFLRGKYFLYDCSLNQPLIVRWPKGCQPPSSYSPGTTDDGMHAAIDITAQTVACAGGEVPSWMHGRPFLGPNDKPRDRIFSAADWYGDSQLKSRSVRTSKYKYIHNYNTTVSVQSASTTYRKAMHPLHHLLPALAEVGQLNPLHQKLLLDPLPQEELYDLEADPHELTNLAADPARQRLKVSLREQLDDWIRDSGDLGFEPLDPGHVKFFDDYHDREQKNHAKKIAKVREKVRAQVVADAN